MIEKRICQACGAGYIGGVLSRFCDKCKKNRSRLQAARWIREHRERALAYRAKRKANYQRKYDLGPVPKESEPEKPYKTPEQLYCASYRADELSCIKCYENQTAPYKGCYKK